MEAPPQGPTHISPKGMWVSKLCLRILGIVMCIAVAGVGGYLGSTNAVDEWIYAMVGPPVFVALAWNIAEGICILARGGRRGIHPGACVGVDLILWLALIVITILLGLIGITSSMLFIGYDYYASNDLYLGYQIQELIGAGRAVLGLCCVLTLTHFTLFVIACYETSQRNRRGPTYVVYNASHMSQYGMPPGMAPPTQVYYQHQPVGQMPVYYSYVPAAQSPETATTTTTTAQTPPPTVGIQPHLQMSAPPPTYTGTRQGENKQELP